ncbi:hydrogenase [soil metagenome]
MTVLLVGIGNTLRRDDGAGMAVVGRFAERPDCRVLGVHQLLPEHVDELACSDRVVFVDAAVDAEQVLLDRVATSTVHTALGHTCDPAGLLALCESLHGRTPVAWLLTIPAYDLGFGEWLSDETAAGVEVAVRRLAEWLACHTT